MDKRLPFPIVKVPLERQVLPTHTPILGEAFYHRDTRQNQTRAFLRSFRIFLVEKKGDVSLEEPFRPCNIPPR